MINLNVSSSAVSWPTTPPSSAIAPVAAVPVAPAIPSGGHDTQTGPRSGRDGGHAQPFQMPRGERQAAASAARAAAREAGADPAATAATDPQAVAARQQAEQQVAQKAREREKQAMEHLKNVLSSVWQASAAVVDRALGRETDPLNNQSDTAPDLSQVAATLVARKLPVLTTGPGRLATPTPAPASQPADWASSTAEVDIDIGPAQDPASADVVAYDEHGNSSLMPLEAGSLISHRV